MSKKPHADISWFNNGIDYRTTFNENYRNAYVEYGLRLRHTIEQMREVATSPEGWSSSGEPTRVLDLGCGDGWIAEALLRHTTLDAFYYYGLDTSATAITGFLAIEREYNTTGELFRSEPREGDALWVVDESRRAEMKDTFGGCPHLITCNASGHQIRKQSATRGAIGSGELVQLYASALDFLAPGGRLLIGDYFYDTEASSKLIDKSMAWIHEKTGQNPTPPELFVQPQFLETRLKDACPTATIELYPTCNANSQICLQYYCLECWF